MKVQSEFSWIFSESYITIDSNSQQWQPTGGQKWWWLQQQGEFQHNY